MSGGIGDICIHKVVPPNKLPQAVRVAQDFMERLDLHVFEIFDASEPGTSELPKNIVDVYYKEMPRAIGFYNGYGPTYTSDCRDGKPFISYDYYLSPKMTGEKAVADLKELAHINPKRRIFWHFMPEKATKLRGAKTSSMNWDLSFKLYLRMSS